MRRRLLFAVPLLLLLGLAVLLGKGLSLNPREVPTPFMGKPLPAFTAERLSPGDAPFSPDAMVGKVWILNVWASWCAPCREEHPVLMDLALRGQVTLVGLNYKDQRDAAQKWLRQFGDPYGASLFDPHGRIGLDLGVYGVPETFVIDRTGRVRFKHTGALTDTLVRERVAPLLAQLQGDPA